MGGLGSSPSITHGIYASHLVLEYIAVSKVLTYLLAFKVY